MDSGAKWIWLDPEKYPDFQKGYCRYLAGVNKGQTLSLFKKKYDFGKEMERAVISVSGDVAFRLSLNGEYLCRGPVCVGGNHDGSLYYDPGFKEAETYGDTPPFHYYQEVTVSPKGRSAEFFAEVFLWPCAADETSSGYGGFILSADIFFTDGTQKTVFSDESWLCSVRNSFRSLTERDYRLPDDEFTSAKESKVKRYLRKSPIPVQTEEKILPANFSSVTVRAGESAKTVIEYDKVYSGELVLDFEADGLFEVSVGIFEVNDNKITYRETFTADQSVKYRMTRFTGIGGAIVEITNKGDAAVTLANAGLVFIHYPVEKEGFFKCSDPALETIYNVCKHTLKICRQTHSLDSPKHRENLGCTGDYYVESLINSVTFGDMRLYRFDLTRTADMLSLARGKMFHTTYSLIFVMMAYDYYRITGDETALSDCEKGMDALFSRFEGYLDQNGVIDDPPDYMFVDWIYEDDFSMHHPPKALGQTVLNAFYYGALRTAEKIYGILTKKEKAEKCRANADRLLAVFDQYFYDEEKGLYFEGTASPSKHENRWNPENVNKRYFAVHSNTLAVLYGLAKGEKAKAIMEKVVNDESLIPCQPYFMHFVLEAVNVTGLFDRYGIALIKKWQKLTDVSTKALREGWIDMPGYGYDFSHAWGGTPAYQLPSKLTGLKIVKPGYREIELSPRLCGLKEFEVLIPSAMGDIYVKKNEKETVVKVPENVKYTIKE